MSVALIQPLPVERDRDGWWSHPGIPDFSEDVKAFNAWLEEQGLEVTHKMLESEGESHPVYVSYFENEDTNITAWEPTEPAGAGWFTFSIHDTEDGPAYVWARRRAGDAA